MLFDTSDDDDVEMDSFFFFIFKSLYFDYPNYFDNDIYYRIIYNIFREITLTSFYNTISLYLVSSHAIIGLLFYLA